MKGITCVVQCFNNKSDHRAGISLHQSLASGPAMEKWIMFVLTHNANFNPRGIFVGYSDHFTDEGFGGLFMSKDPRGRLFHCPFQLYGKKDQEKTRRKVPNLNAVEVIVSRHIHLCSSTSTSFSTHPPLCKTYFLLTYFKIYFACGKLFQFCRLLAQRSSA